MQLEVEFLRRVCEGLMPAKVQRVRDPVHGLIIFERNGHQSRVDQTAWKLINTSEFQRLRRIRQLGVSETTFPNAVHTRFAHSIGVFHTARRLVELLRKFIPESEFNQDRANTAMLAALLHDVGHGAFSHAFESVQKFRGQEKHHEQWTADIIRNEDGEIKPILERFRLGMSDHIAHLLEADIPEDVYHAVVSSSFDADRLDYLRRDRLMTGSGAGAIDFDWLMDNIRTAEISLAADDEEEDAPKVTTFCLAEKATQSAESFLLARYHLFHQIYLHKTTRGFEALLVALLTKVARAAEAGEPQVVGLDTNNPFIRFFQEKGGTVSNYLALDDFELWGAIARIAQCDDAEASELGRRLRSRKLYKCLDIETLFPVIPGEDAESTDNRRVREIAKIDGLVKRRIGGAVLKDVSPISAYGEVGADNTKRHKMLSILMGDRTTREITQLAPAIRGIVKKRSIVRYYFKEESDRTHVLRGTAL